MVRNKKIINATINEYNGIKFRSKLESNTAKLLDKLNLKYEYESKKFILMPSFKYNNETIRAISYKPDFKIGNIIIECKGFPSDSWKIKRKLFMKELKEHYHEYFYKEIHSIKELTEFINTHNKLLTMNNSLQTIKKMLPCLPEKDIGFAKKYFEKRDFESLLEIVESDIYKAKKRQEELNSLTELVTKMKQEKLYTKYKEERTKLEDSIIELTELKMEITSYMSYLDPTESEDN